MRTAIRSARRSLVPLALFCACGGDAVRPVRPVVGLVALDHRDVEGTAWEVERVDGTGDVALLVLAQDWPLPRGSVQLRDVPTLGTIWTTSEGPAGFHVVATEDDLATSVSVSGTREDVVVIDGSTGETILSRAGEDRVGVHLGAVGDIDGDAVADVVLGAFVPDSSEGGIVEAISGADGSVLWSREGDPGEFLGVDSLVSIADRDGDGLRDVATQHYVGTFGSVAILSSASGASIADVAIPDLDTGVCREGAAALLLVTFREGIATLHAWSDDRGEIWSKEGYGYGCAAFGTRDVDADGRPDLLAAEGPEAPGRPIVALSGETGEEIFRTAPEGALGADIVDLPEIDGWAMVDRRPNAGLWLLAATY